MSTLACRKKCSILNAPDACSQIAIQLAFIVIKGVMVMGDARVNATEKERSPRHHGMSEQISKSEHRDWFYIV